MPKVKTKPVKLSERLAGGAAAASTSRRSSASKADEQCPAGMQEFLDDSEFYVSVKVDEGAVNGALHPLGTFQLRLVEPLDADLLEKVSELWLYVSAIPGRSIVYAEWLEEKVKQAVFYRVDEESDLTFLADEKPGKIVCFTLTGEKTDLSVLSVKVSVHDSFVSSDDPSSVGQGSSSVRHLVGHFFNLEMPQIAFHKAGKESMRNIHLLYDSIKQHHAQQHLPQTQVQNPLLQVSLRPYQMQSVRWMLLREGLSSSDEASRELHPLFRDLGRRLFFNPYLGTLARERPVAKPPTPGGILADEMGLGKTVEVLACILAHPCTHLQDQDDALEIQDVEEAFIPVMPAERQERKDCEKFMVKTIDGVFIRKPKRTLPSVEDEELTKDDESSQSSSGRKRSLEGEQGDDDSPDRKRVRFCPKVSFIPSKKFVKDASTDKEPSRPIIKPFEKPQNLPLTDKEVKALTNISRRKAREEAYLKSLAEFSGVKHLQRKSRGAGLFDSTEIERKSMFECVCGVVADAALDDNSETKVKCAECGLVQHRKCVRFVGNASLYHCPHCNVRRPLLKVKTTLIVAPDAISQQWMHELEKLVSKDSLKVKFYNGVYMDGYHQPSSLAKYDVLVTSYEVLNKELDYVDLPHCNAAGGRRFRNAKRYSALPSPLVCVHWWRVCLDEAQMVECTTTKSAEMALRLTAVHRWCITGTPVQHSLQDLFGLVLFLGVDPYCVDKWWQVLVQGPFLAGDPEPLCRLICPLMWRTLKVDVLEQIQLPPQTEQVHWVNFSPVEEHFYRRQHVECANAVLERLAQHATLEVRLQTLDKEALDKLLRPLLHLRQACCHPQAVTGRSSIATNKNVNRTITMKELLTNLINRARSECEESLRVIISSLNGMAGLELIQGHWKQAAQHYREVLSLVEENKEQIKSDKLQRIHTLCNLQEVLDAERDGVVRTESERDLATDAKSLETEYLAKFITLVENAKQALEPLSAKVGQLEEGLELDEAWWSSVLTLVASLDEEEEVVERVRQAIEGVSKKTPKDLKKKIQQFKNLATMEATLLQTTEAMVNEHKRVLDEMHRLEVQDPQVLVNEAVDCHLRTIVSDQAKSKSRCSLCKVSDKFKDYEKVLFREVTTKDNYEHLELDDVRIFGQLQTIVWAAGDTERVLKTLLSYAKLKNADETWLKDGATHLKVIEAKKKEFKSLRFLWSQINDYVSAVDELNMCKLRFRVRMENEPVVKQQARKKGANLSSNLQNRVEHIHVIEPHEVEPQVLRLTLERSEGERGLRRRKGQLHYLLNLEQNDIASDGADNPETCPICARTLGKQWTVLVCGHCFCVECLEEVKRRRANKRSVGCAVCREETALGEVSYVNTLMQPELEARKQSQVDAEPQPTSLADLKKLGYSAKAGAVVRAAKAILNANPADKILVFSAWTSMLDVLQRALTENNISCAQVGSGKKFQEAIDLFKDAQKKVTVLLLPVARGSKGLNLTEARHVFLIEPILNPASELQALGRVHRIGQDKYVKMSSQCGSWFKVKLSFASGRLRCTAFW
ncbi:Hypothetical predicted protein [Cloeon dipterum]|uniref:RING-type domain-containing protein n=1 Tax=Cloeon dipterum TaxID=197152 RepID=A0A8S1DWG3_9INSE|nr:Hypothetical predicted protein [Cloeon dipterum]